MAIKSVEIDERTYAKAFQAFVAAFDDGYAKAKSQLADGAVSSLPGIVERFFIDVPRFDLHGERWKHHVDRFRQCGRVAALSADRRGGAKLKLGESDSECWRWVVDTCPDG